MNDQQHTRFGNVAAIRGAVRADPILRELPGGGAVAQFDVVTATMSNGRELTVSVPVAWHDPTDAQLGIVTSGADVVVIGTVRRRFFRVGAATQSRTEVVADVVVPTRQRKRVATALCDAADRVLDLAA